MNLLEFQAGLDAIRTAAFKAVDHELMEAHALPATLYHYTAEANLEPILESGCLRATEGRYLNDDTELRHAGHLIADYLRGDFPRVMGLLGIVHDAGWLLKPIVGALDQHLSAPEHLMFVLSFTRLSNSLSQWARYAGDGNGVALGFDLTMLRASDAAPLGVGLSEPVVGPCTYDARLQNSAIERTIKPLIDFAIAEEKAFGPELRVELIRATAAHVLVASALLGGTLKHPGFVEEDEWRVLVLATTRDTPPTVKTRPHRYASGLASYIELPFGDVAGLPLTHVVLGPRIDGPTETRIRESLARHGQSPTITRSDIPYRG